MEPSRVQEIKAVARELGVPYQSLIRMWIVERLRRELVGLHEWTPRRTNSLIR